MEKSGLAHYSGRGFVARDDRSRFDEYWKTEFHPEYGRYMAWVLFSVGAENLAKAACVCSVVLKVDGGPTLSNYVNTHFKKLCREMRLNGSDDESTLIGGYKQLVSIRNRDAHSYRKNVRDANFPLVEEAFVPAFDILMEAMKRGGHPPAQF